MIKVCLDPGHSGPVEPGACAVGYTEAALTLSIVQALGAMLAAENYDVIYTRTGDIDDDGLAFRAEIANEAGADIFLSIHCNAAESTEAYGVETYHYPGSGEGGLLADAIQEELAGAAYTRDRGVKGANFAVLRLTDMPAVLIECGFITSEHDRATLCSEDGQQTIAAAILAGVQTYFR